MKSIYLLSILALVISSSCQQKIKNEVVDISAIKNSINAFIDEYKEAYNTRNVTVLSTMLADDGLYCGTAPDEIWEKQKIIALWEAVFPDTTLNLKYSEEFREIKIADDGKSAIVVKRISVVWSPNIQSRQTLHLTAIDDGWIIDFISWAFLVKNEDIDILNAALE